jgi:hypothetical protein
MSVVSREATTKTFSLGGNPPFPRTGIDVSLTMRHYIHSSVITFHIQSVAVHAVLPPGRCRASSKLATTGTRGNWRGTVLTRL